MRLGQLVDDRHDLVARRDDRDDRSPRDRDPRFAMAESYAKRRFAFTQAGGAALRTGRSDDDSGSCRLDSGSPLPAKEN